MLIEIFIKEFAIIEELRINFQKGLNILTGETGAGKSIIIDAIELIVGGRSSTEFIRNNADKAEIEALLNISGEHPVNEILNDYGISISEDEMLIIKREIFSNGKSICRINGQLVTLAILKDVGQYLIHLYSQLQHQQLLHSRKQLNLLDSYGEPSHINRVEAFKESYGKYALLKMEIELLQDDEHKRAQRIDLLQYQINEIGQAKLRTGEEEELIQQKNLIKHTEKISSGLYNAYNALSKENGAIDLLSSAMSNLEQITMYDGKINKIYEDISSMFYQLEDIRVELGQRVSSLELNPKQIDSIEERLSVIYLLKRKYGDSITKILEYSDDIKKELNLIQNREEYLNIKQQELADLTKKLSADALEISEKRAMIAVELAEQIEKELIELQMDKTKIEIELGYEESGDGIQINRKKYKITQHGLDNIEFLISPNPGESLKPLNKIASGGELSRIMLAILTILAHKEPVGTIIFDEIDTGVSGKAAQSIAEKLARVSKNKQVFVVTHLPQVASMADYHYLIEKTTNDDLTKTKIHTLEENEKINTLARMSGGKELTDITYKHAQEMIEKAKIFKATI